MKKQLLTLGLCFALGTVDCADYNPPVHNSLTDEDPFADFELVDDRETDDFLHTVDNTSTSKPEGFGTQTSGTLLAPSIATAAACAARSSEKQINSTSKRQKKPKEKIHLDLNSQSNPLANIPVLDFAEASGCAAVSPGAASALVSASYPDAHTQTHADPSQTRLEEFNNLRASKQGEELQGRLAEAFDETFFTVHENGTASCSKGNKFCRSTEYKKSFTQLSAWKNHCITHLKPKDYILLKSFLKKIEKPQRNSMYKCTLCDRLNNSAITSAFRHLISQHFNKK